MTSRRRKDRGMLDWDERIASRGKFEEAPDRNGNRRQKRAWDRLNGSQQQVGEETPDELRQP